MGYLQSLIPRDHHDKVATVFCWFAIHFICLFELIVVLPQAHQDQPEEYWKHVVLGFFLYFNVLFSLILTTARTSTTKKLMLPAVLKPGWRFCYVCESNNPPRSHHCGTCNICVLRRDHHCVFTGNCIGLNNQRHFITLSMYLFLGALYCNYLNSEMVYDLLSGFTWKSALTMIIPWMAWMMGLAEGYTFMVAIMSSTCILGMVFLAALMGYHIKNLKSGQVTYESTHKVKDFDCGWKSNVQQVFGERWHYSWMCSLIKSPLPTDGLDYPMRRSHEPIKSM